MRKAVDNGSLCVLLLVLAVSGSTKALGGDPLRESVVCYTASKDHYTSQQEITELLAEIIGNRPMESGSCAHLGLCFYNVVATGGSFGNSVMLLLFSEVLQSPEPDTALYAGNTTLEGFQFIAWAFIILSLVGSSLVLLF